MITSGFFLIVAIVLLVVLIVCSKRVYEGHSAKGGGGGKGAGGFKNAVEGQNALGEYGKLRWGYPYWALFTDWYYPNWLTCNQEKVIKNCESECNKGINECNDCFVKNC
jgi:hypothetical protein